MKRGDSLEAIEPFIGELIEAAAPARRRKMMDRMMRLVRRANAKRIAANVEPDGGAMAPRKKRPRPVRRKMFKNIGKTRSLRLRITPDQGELRFANPLIEDTAAVHHFGLPGYVGKTRAGRIIRTKYEARRLLGFGKERDDLLEEALKHFDP